MKLTRERKSSSYHHLQKLQPILRCHQNLRPLLKILKNQHTPTKNLSFPHAELRYLAVSRSQSIHCTPQRQSYVARSALSIGSEKIGSSYEEDSNKDRDHLLKFILLDAPTHLHVPRINLTFLTLLIYHSHNEYIFLSFTSILIPDVMQPEAPSNALVRSH